MAVMWDPPWDPRGTGGGAVVARHNTTRCCSTEEQRALVGGQGVVVWDPVGPAVGRWRAANSAGCSSERSTCFCITTPGVLHL